MLLSKESDLAEAEVESISLVRSASNPLKRNESKQASETNEITNDLTAHEGVRRRARKRERERERERERGERVAKEREGARER